ncbi:hypothetical protein PVAP13_9KG092723 [Panicum virgatum]|uniref:Uncharacterized protein n=1 Tax=Panicum virgatum TaxID=38727 RepID=A0A8T0NW79_PANVG|nr:hypothetical protein PVAP13_9KG092723 [Panicum virgatum]
MPRCYAESGFIRKASEERISNSWNKHSSLTQSSQQLKREEEFNKVLHINKVKGTHSISDAFLGTAQKQSMVYWNKHMIPFCLLM